MTNIDLNKINHFVLHKQHLTDDTQTSDIVQIVSDISGLHATGTKEPYLALFARSRNFVKEQLDDELYVKRNLGKIRCMRGTLYILEREMIPVAYAATVAMVEKLSRRYAEFHGISMKKYLDVSKSILDLVRRREMTAAEVKAKLGTDLHISALLNLMCDQGLLVRIQPGNWRAKNYTYAPFSDYFKDIDLTQLSESEGIILLVQQYLSSFGPATENDIIWWIGLTKTKVREALGRLKGQVTPLSIPNLEGDFVVLRSDLDLITNAEFRGRPTVNLLPTLDPYLMGYKQRERYLSHEHYDKIFDRSGNATSAILLDGRVAGVWDFSEDTEHQIKVCLFEELSEDILQQIYLKSQEMGRFMTEEVVAIKRVSSMVPLTQRVAGAFMSPLKGCK